VGKKVRVIALLSLISGTAAAQPGQTSPAPPVYRPPAPRVTPDEYKMLVRGEITDNQRVGGGLLGTFVGLGTGHIAQGRWGERGWIFTVGEVVTYGILLAEMIDCWEISGDNSGCDEGWIVAGALGFAGFRIWEIVDVWAYPPDYNRRVRELRARVYGPAYYYGTPAPPVPPPVYLRPVDGGYAGGITLRF
jgi:hypothetical protein